MKITSLNTDENVENLDQLYISDVNIKYYCYSGKIV